STVGVDNNCDLSLNDIDANASDKVDFYRDQDGDGYSVNTTAKFCAGTSNAGYISNLSNPADCDDSRAGVNPGAAEVCDAGNTDEDCDGKADDQDLQGATGKTTFYADSDGDGYTGSSSAQFCDMPASGYEAANDGDCDDANASVNPGAAEVCDSSNVDEDCDGKADDQDLQGATGKTAFYADSDGDGYTGSSSAQFCDMPASGYEAANDGDCNDANASVNPGAAETCNGIDDDCVGGIDNGLTFVDYYLDADQDTYGTGSATSSCSVIAGRATRGGDCDDGRADVFPGAAEVCDAGNTDEDCDGKADDLDLQGATGKTTFYADSDGDGYTGSSSAQFCDMPASGYEGANDGDCNDSNASVNPGAAEVCDAGNTDEDCDGLADNADSSATGKTNWYADADGDTYGAGTAISACDATGTQVANNADCNDSNAAIKPGADEICDGIDQNCDGAIDNGLTQYTYYRDQDTDGFGDENTTVSTCSSSAPAGYVSNLLDCNDALVTYGDDDEDGFGAGAPTPCGVGNDDDCDDGNDTRNPNGVELCSNLPVDNDCDGSVLETEATDRATFYRDADGDGYTGSTTGQFCTAPAGYESTNEGDCNDNSTAVRPGAVENCLNLGTDNDCDGVNNDAEAVDATEYYADADNDGFGNGESDAVRSCSALNGFVTNGTDANDNLVTYGDDDGDGFGAGSMTPDGSPFNSDCNDGDDTIYPGALENCANLGVNNDCDGQNDAAEAVDSVSYYVDGDQDGFGAGAATKSCSAIAGSVTNNADCDDAQTTYGDADGDGFGAGAKTACGVSNNSDCDDSKLLYADTDGDGVGAGSPVACGVQSNNDNCPSAANADHANCDTDAQGNACDGDDDDDAVGDSDDAFPCNATSSVANGTLNPTQLAAFLAGASGVQVDAGGMTPAQLIAVADGASAIAANGIFGTFTITKDLSALRITAILDKVQVGSFFTGGANVTIDATGMNPGQLSAVAADIAAVNTVENLTLTSATLPGDITALVSKTPSGEATIVASGMSDAQLAASISGPNSVSVTGSEVMGAGLTPAQIAELTGSLAATGTSVQFNTAGMTPDQQQAVNDSLAALAAANGGVNPYCDTTDNDLDTYYGDACTAALDDCDDSSPAAYPGAVENCLNDGVDNDCDGEASSDAEAIDSTSYFVDGDSDGAGAGTATKSCTAIAGSVTNNTDCNDANALLTLPIAYFVDGDNDGYGSTATASFCQLAPPAGYAASNTDCNDANASISPGDAEVCNSIDDDCDGSADDGLTFLNYYVDGDADGYGAGAATSSCAPISGSVTSAGDCDDGNASINPSRSETCNGIDDNCNSSIDEGVQTAFYADADNDGAGDPATMQLACSAPAGYVTSSNDQCPSNGTLVSALTYYSDIDGDGAGNPSDTISSCSNTPPSGYVATAGDGCPGDANKTAPGACGCGVADTDSDGDGVANCNDGCPNDPNKLSPGTCGC
ncbi:MAG: putative metal-binding motif-containing protein, partial [Planctomycetota bacterium]